MPGFLFAGDRGKPSTRSPTADPLAEIGYLRFPTPTPLDSPEPACGQAPASMSGVLSLRLARLVDDHYPGWFQSVPAPGDYLDSRSHSARVKMSHYAVLGTFTRFLKVGCGTGSKVAV
jgi:hypothetical protein